MADPRNFLLNSDYPLDKAILLKSDLITSFGSFYSFSHGLSFTPLIVVVWSMTSDFTTSYGIGGGPLSATPFIAFDPLCQAAWATSSEVFVQFSNFIGSPVYIRIYGIEPTTSSADLSFTSISADNFTLNTDYNYTKLLDSGVTDWSSTPSSTVVVAHNLGYYPQVEVWYERPSKIQCLGIINTSDASGYFSSSVDVGTTNVTFIRDPYLAENERFHYRIYADEL